MENTTPTINKNHTAYRIGFSDALGTTTYNAYTDVLRWYSYMPAGLKRRMRLSYFKGWAAGIAAVTAVKKLNDQKYMVG